MEAQISSAATASNLAFCLAEIDRGTTVLEQNLGSRGQKDEPTPHMLITFKATAQPAIGSHAGILRM